MLNDVVITEETDDDDDEEVEVVRMVEDEDYNEVQFLFQSRTKICESAATFGYSGTKAEDAIFSCLICASTRRLTRNNGLVWFQGISRWFQLFCFKALGRVGFINEESTTKLLLYP